jgi:antitoxin component YwqK of YwqJK toxin-antitoxin module
MIGSYEYMFALNTLIPSYIDNYETFACYFNAMIKNRDCVVKKEVMNRKKEEFIVTIEKRRKDGTMLEKYQKRGDEMYGDYIIYTNDGEIDTIFDNVHKEGNCIRYFHEYDVNYSIVPHIKMIRNGSYKKFGHDGRLIYEGHVENDEFEGEGREYDDEGVCIRIDTYKKGMKIKIEKPQYNKVYERDEDRGGYVLKIYNDQNILVEEVGVPDEDERSYEGKYKLWYDNGQLKVERRYVGGVVMGKYKEWYENGQIKIDTYRDGDSFDGYYQGWYENGVLRTKASFRYGKLIGIYNEWYDNGRMKAYSTYVNGRLDGLCKKWDMDGNLIESNIDDIPYQCDVSGLFE